MNVTTRESARARAELEAHYETLIEPNPSLSRALVSYQANKALPVFRWFRFKEGFSAPMVEYLVEHFGGTQDQTFLDPFSGSGTALFVLQRLGWRPFGVELLPIGRAVVEARNAMARVTSAELRNARDHIESANLADCGKRGSKLIELNITAGAYPESNKQQIDGLLQLTANGQFSQDVGLLVNFAALCVLETVSYTRKDGQYLRWDRRASKGHRKSSFDKGNIPDFKDALVSKFNQMIEDYETPGLWPSQSENVHPIELIEGTVLEKIHDLESASIDLTITSPPYLNRYDYTRTYALELAFLGLDDEHIKRLRQEMLSCTVENREKDQQLFDLSVNRQKLDQFQEVRNVLESHEALGEVLFSLESLRKDGKLNNPNVVRMVRNYFYEMAYLVFELARVTRSGGRVYMINDNVRYGGEVIPVDLILSDVAARAGLSTKRIWILSRGKGNSSQQMGTHGREEIRKSVYVWEKQ